MSNQHPSTSGQVPVDLPAVDAMTSSFAVFFAERRMVRYSAALDHFLQQCRWQEKTPVVHTAWQSRLTAHAAFELARQGVGWTATSPEEALYDVWGLRKVAGFDQLVARTGKAEPATLPSGAQPASAVVIDVLAQHRAEPNVLVGGLAQDAFALLGSRAPQTWGTVEPFVGMWNRTDVTRWAHAGMPKTGYGRGRSADGAWLSMRVERVPDGLVEQLRCGMVLEPDASANAMDLAEAVLRELVGTHRVLVASATLVDTDPDGGTGVRATQPDVPLAWAMGPRLLAAAAVDVPAMLADFGASQLGRAKVPTLLFRFDRPHRDPQLSFAAIVAAVAFDPETAQDVLRTAQGDSHGA
ncbi:MAG: DUF6177 family protein [Arachnia sp.]